MIVSIMFVGNTENLSAIIKKHEDLRNVRLNQICAEARVIAATDETGTVKYVKTLESENSQLLDHYCPKVIAFGLQNFHVETMKEMREFTEGDSFTKLLNSRGQHLEKDKRMKLSVDEIFAEVWEPAKKQWIGHCLKLKIGDLFFSDFQKLFQTDNLEKLRSELKKHNKEEKSDWIDQRINQFKQYKTICNCLDGAKAIMKVVRAYNLKGNFTQIQDIMKLVSLTLKGVVYIFRSIGPKG